MSSPAAQRLGRRRAAALLLQLTGQPVSSQDIDDLVLAGVLTFVGRYGDQDNPVLDVEALRGLAARDDFTELLDTHRLIGPRDAAAYLGIRPADFKYVCAAGWISPAATHRKNVGHRNRQIQYGAYRKRELQALYELPGVDWDKVRATPAGHHSPLRAFADRPPSRAQIVRWFCTRVSHLYQVPVWTWWENHSGVWHIDWDPDGQLTRGMVELALREDPIASQYTEVIRVGSNAGAVLQWARDMLVPGRSVVLDTETHDLPGRVCDLAVADAASGDVLLDTLVHPGVPISAQAQAVHGISDDMVDSAPTFDQVLPRLLEVVAGRTVLAYNAGYDQEVICDHAVAVGADPGRLACESTWGCIMINWAGYQRQSRWSKLGGTHRALGDALAARQVLLAMASPPQGKQR